MALRSGSGRPKHIKRTAKPVRFKVNQKIVYPAHGVGKVVAVEEQTIAEHTLELYVVKFEQDKMTLSVPTAKAQQAGMRPLSNELVLKDAFTTLKGRPRVKRTMWSRRAQEYEAKINSGDLILVAEVVRDLFRLPEQPEQSYSERQLFEQSLDRMMREVAAIKKWDHGRATDELMEILSVNRKKILAKKEAAEAAKAENENSKGEEAA